MDFDTDAGWVKLPRNLLYKALMQNPTALQVFIFLLLKAEYKQKEVCSRNKPITLNPGQVIIGRQKISEALGIGEQVFRTALKFLTENNMLTSTSDNHRTIITITNWDIYGKTDIENTLQKESDLTSTQPAPNQDLTSTQPAPNQDLTSTQPAPNHTLKNINNIKEIKEIKELKENKEIINAGTEVPPAQKIPDERYIQFTRKFQNEVCINKGNTAPVVNDTMILKGAKQLELAVNKDCFDWDELQAALLWSTSDEFWSENLRSLAQMRERTKSGSTKIQMVVSKYRQSKKEKESEPKPSRWPRN